MKLVCLLNISPSRNFVKTGRIDTGQWFENICSFPILYIGTTFAILSCVNKSSTHNITKSAAGLHREIIGGSHWSLYFHHWIKAHRTTQQWGTWNIDLKKHIFSTAQYYVFDIYRYGIYINTFRKLVSQGQNEILKKENIAL